MNTIHMLPPLSDEDKELSWKYPAAESRGTFYLIQGDKVIGRVKMDAARGLPNGMYERVSVRPADEATTEFFKDDFTIPLFGKVTNLSYDGITGSPWRWCDDEPEDRHMGTEIVDEINFDFGIAHPRHAHIKGFGAGRKGQIVRVHTVQKNRRPRNSNKIKKVRA